MSFVDESDFQKEGKCYILSKNSQFEECSTVPLDINGSLASILDFGEDIVSKAAAIRVVFLRTMVAKTTRTVIIIYRILPHISNFFILQPKSVVAILFSRDSNCKVYNYLKVAGDNF